ncbi:MAG: glycerol-3-phosphate 1-O-acyltransferase PlsY [Traorella sp.]
MIYIISIILGYLLGSIPFALVIGLVFYHTDIRNYGSGNLGGTNAGRILGKKAGMAVIILDALKAFIPVAIISYFSTEASIWCGLAVCVGHCYPVFANFKGGKAAASMFGFLLAIALFTASNWLCFVLPFGCFLITLYLSKMVSLSSMVAALTSTISLILIKQPFVVIIASILLDILIIYRHKENIQRIKNGTERKITWM